MKFTTLMASAALALGLAGGAYAQDKTKVGFVFVGPVGDGGWTYEHNQGRLAVEKEFGDAVETVFVENVAEGPDSERVMTQMALDGADLIFTTSFGYMDPTINVAGKFPDVKFEHATGYKRADNVSTYSARFYEGRAIQGHIAGKMTKSNIIGYIGSFPIPEVIRGINAAYLAASEVNPDVDFRIVWVYSWIDPGKEADAANTLIEQGADVIMQHTDSTAPMTIAEATWEGLEEGERGVYAFGQASDMAEFGPTARLSSIIDDWAPYYIERVQAAMDGTWESVDSWHGLDQGMTSIGAFNASIPADIRKEAMDATIRIAAGTSHAFTGPINWQNGEAWLAEGETADDGTLLGMNRYVEGIEGTVPN